MNTLKLKTLKMYYKTKTIKTAWFWIKRKKITKLPNNIVQHIQKLSIQLKAVSQTNNDTEGY